MALHVAGLERIPVEDLRKIAAAALHPVQAAILAELHGTDTALSPKVLADRMPGRSVSLVAYHVHVLADKGLLAEVSTRPRRGAVEHFYRPVRAR